MVSMRNKKNYPPVIIKYPSYLELWIIPPHPGAPSVVDINIFKIA